MRFQLILVDRIGFRIWARDCDRDRDRDLHPRPMLTATPNASILRADSKLKPETDSMLMMIRMLPNVQTISDLAPLVQPFVQQKDRSVGRK